MIGKIETTQDIILEKERLEAEAEMHKQQLKENIGTIQEEIKVSNLAKDVLRSPNTQEAVKYALGIGSFLALNLILPRRTSLIARIALPFVANHYLSKFIDQNYNHWSGQLVNKIDQRQVENRLNASL